ncbi:MAG: DegV family protein [Spirochaetales bacterium]|nr:DegV family protein [Candidatus Physcosoma equi]
MREIKLFTDSCSDLPKRIRDKYDVSYFRFNFMKNGEEREADLDWKNIKPEELYDGLREGDHVYTLPALELNIYRKMVSYIKKNYDIIYIACPEVLSKTIVKARHVAEKILDEYPDARIDVIDSYNASMGIGLLVAKAGEMIKEGLTLDEIVEKISALRNRINQYAAVGTLTYLSRANRINASAAILGNLLNLKPILTADVVGRQSALFQIRGREASIQKVADLFCEAVEKPEEQDIYIMHADCKEDALHLQALIEEKGVKPKSFKIGDFGPIVGIATGPETVCIFGFGKEVTFRGE